MKVNQISIDENNWSVGLDAINIRPSVILLFVSPEFPFRQEFLSKVNLCYPDAIIIGCSTAGEISDITVKDKTISLTAIQFEKTTLKLVSLDVKNSEACKNTGKEIGEMLYNKDLKHVLVLSDGLLQNDVDLVSGLKKTLNNVSATGGFAGDGTNFKKTFVIKNNEILDNTVLALGFYGDSIQVGYGSKGGWDSFGIERLVTKSHKNVLYELDGQPALELYKRLLGEDAKDLPGSGLLFPFKIRSGKNGVPVVRGISGINEEDQSLTFGSNIPQGAYLRLMKGNLDRLINGAEEAATDAVQGFTEASSLAILVSCVGRRLVLRQLVEEEVEVVKEVVGNETSITGFYSYGEIAPVDKATSTELHHQTMTVTTISEC
ncbi:FIST signal transduction protein [Algibacter miyuki]|uniref:FIST signal transduction protein n=1 Tax=Algibacter miyuki TaxID=1306933 RepID=A0ABV5H263_9FLAO|nr:FIST N-terminal domain-containing protein [Algibacter miyuki]MDN3666181.1 FIST N-terminal domain-containing protein [Algibacter miyuki]